MDLQQAVKKALQVITRVSKEDRAKLGLMVQKIRFGSGQLESGVWECQPYVTSRTDRMGIICYVGEHLPAALLDPLQCKAASEASWASVSVSPGERVLVVGSGGKRVFRIPCEDVLGYPQIPDMPQQWDEVEAEDWRAVLGVVHAAGTPKVSDMLRVIRFTPDHVEATDSERVAVAWVALSEFQGQVASEFFRAWPKGTVEVGTAGRYLWARIGSELRWAVKQDVRAPDMSARWRDTVLQGVVVDTVSLQRAVKAGVKVSDTQTLRVSITEDEVEITAHVKKGETRGYRAVVPVLDFSGDWSREWILVAGRAFYDALRAYRTPCMGMRFAGGLNPLALCSGRHMELLWPRI
jgi:hypothetical protein